MIGQRRKDRRRSFWSILPTLTTLAAVQGTAAGGSGGHQPAPGAGHRPVTVAGLSQHLITAAPLLPSPLKISPARDFGYLHRMPEFHARATIASSVVQAFPKNIVVSRVALAGPHIVLDGTLGSSGAVQSTLGNYSIASDLGQQQGANLFQSFTRLDLTFGESATFSGPSSVQNVIARVTGGAQSSIDGTIRCTIPGANVFLINASGVVFGSNSQLDVMGSFAVTTASAIKLADGGRVNAANPLASVLTNAAPVAFAFLTPAPAPITIAGIGNKRCALTVPAAKVVSLIGGPIQLESGVLAAPDGRVNMVAVASAGDVAFDATNLDSPINLPAGAARADIGLTASTISADGNGGGRVTIRGNNVIFQNSAISAQTLSAANGRGIDIDAAGQFSLVGSSLSTADGPTGRNLTGTGNTGSISISAGSVLMDSTDASATLLTDARSTGGARAGGIQITTPTLEVINPLLRTSFLSAQGDVPGIVTVTAGTIMFNGVPGQLQPLANTGQFGFFSNVSSVITDSTLGGAAMRLDGPVVHVDSSMGKLVGNNLFLSFSLFNIHADETVEFDGPAGVSNVIARVTGNTLSEIDGAFSCPIAGANLFLINPAGIQFNSATLDVKASFAATTAGLMRFSDGRKFDARSPADTRLTAANPISFGFSGAAPGAITVRISGSSVPALSVPAGATLALVGGDVKTEQSYITAPGGRVNIVGARGAGNVPIAIGLDDPLNLPPGLVRAPVSISDGSIDTSGDGGRISIRGSDVSLSDTSLSAPTDVAAGRGVDINASRQFSLVRAGITAGNNGATGTGAGASVAISAASILIDGRDNPYQEFVGVVTDSTGSGSAGNILLRAGSVRVFEPITISAVGPTHAGRFTLNSPVITLDGKRVAATSLLNLINNQTFAAADSGATLVAADPVSASSVSGRNLPTLQTSSGSTGAAAPDPTTINAAAAPPPTIVPDNSLATGVTFAGPNYLITASAGRQVGANLFESFSQFVLPANQSATFSGPASVANLLVRITGGSPAIIDGHLVCTISGANLFILGPSGVMFGPNAVLNLSGSLAASTANSIGLSDGGTFSAALSGGTMLTGGTPSTFVFSGPAAAINVAGFGPNPLNSMSPPLQLPDGAVFSLIGGNISLNGRAIQVPSGGVKLISTASAGRVMLDATNPRAGIILRQFSTYGSVTLANQSTIDVSDDPNTAMTAARVAIRAGNLSLDQSSIRAETTGGAGGAGIDIALTDSLNLTNSMLDAASSLQPTADRGGDIRIVANTLTFSNSMIGTSGLLSTGTAPNPFFMMFAVNGSVTVLAAGKVTMTGSTIDVASGVFEASVGSATLTGSTLSAIPDADGFRGFAFYAPGIIHLTADQSLTVSNKSVITATANANDNIFSGGSIELIAGSFSLTGGSQVDASVAGSASGGNIQITARGAVRISNAGTAISSEALVGGAEGPFGVDGVAGGTGGDIRINSATIRLSNGAHVSTSAQGGTSGNISFTAGSIAISGSGTSLQAGSADAILESGPLSFPAPAIRGGDINLTATDNFSLTVGAGISTKSSAAGGNIDIGGKKLLVDSAMISAEAGSLGNISLIAGKLMWIQSTTITAQVTTGNGGQIAIDPQYVVLEDSTINGLASNGQDVKVRFAPKVALVQGGSQIESNNVILPSNNDVSGSLLALPSTLPRVTLSLAPVCAPNLEADFSSFVVTGMGGRPPAPGGWVPDLVWDQADAGVSLISERRARLEVRR